MSAVTVKFKACIAMQGRVSLQHPNAPIGMDSNGNVSTYAIHNVPEGYSLAHLTHMVDGTWFNNCYEADFSEIGHGRIVRPKK